MESTNIKYFMLGAHGGGDKLDYVDEEEKTQ